MCSLCNDNTTFPEDMYDHIAQKVYRDSEYCCRFYLNPPLGHITDYNFRRKCISKEPCNYGNPGCATDSDCMTGLVCGLIGNVPTCIDLDECAQNPSICGTDTCINLITTYRLAIFNLIFYIFQNHFSHLVIKPKK